VVAAVTDAGGFGVLGAVAHSPEQLEIDLDWIEANSGGRPYGVDLLLPPKYAGADDDGLDREAVRALLPPQQTAVRRRHPQPLRRAGAQRREPRRSAAAGRHEHLPRGYEPLLDAAFAHQIRLVTSALGPPPPTLIERAYESGVVVVLAGKVTHAVRHRRQAST
jgi:NAD(P)H-dependent flavin oxidoreductase YrpB (nitropropane dioxygenase family)